MKKSWRKTITAVCMGTMLLSGSVYGADSFQDLMAYTDNVLSDGSLIYYFEEVAVTLPADWQGKFEIVTTDNSATFYHKASHEKWQEKYGEDGGKLFTLSCTINHDFSELPDFTYIGFSEESVMNYFMIFPTDFQAYTEDEAVAAEFQQMNAEIDFVKQNAYMLSEGAPAGSDTSAPAGDTQSETVSGSKGTVTTVPGIPGGNGNSDISDFQETQAGYTGSWISVCGEFELYIPSDWEAVDLDEEDQANDIYFAATSSDQSVILVSMAMNLTDGYTQEEIEAELAEGNYNSLFEVAQDALIQQGYTVEKTEMINDIPCAFFSNEDDYGIVFMDQSDSVMEVVYLTGGDVRNNDTVQEVLHSVRWAG